MNRALSVKEQYFKRLIYLKQLILMNNLRKAILKDFSIGLRAKDQQENHQRRIKIMNLDLNPNHIKNKINLHLQKRDPPKNQRNHLQSTRNPN
jgi:hypothetical protein